MEKDPTSRFLDAYASLEDFLRKNYGSGQGYEDMPTLLSRAASTGKIMGSYVDDIRAFVQLRNVLVHKRIDGRFVLTTDEEITKQLERIVQVLTRPPQVQTLFRREVTTMAADAHIGKALTLMGRLSLSQVPVYSDRSFVNVLTSDTIARWLGGNVRDELADLTVPVSEVLKYQEEVETYSFISRTATVFEVLETFDRHARDGQKLSALLITQNGRKTEALLGIITVYDLPEALAALG